MYFKIGSLVKILLAAGFNYIEGINFRATIENSRKLIAAKYAITAYLRKFGKMTRLSICISLSKPILLHWSYVFMKPPPPDRSASKSKLAFKVPFLFSLSHRPIPAGCREVWPMDCDSGYFYSARRPHAKKYDHDTWSWNEYGMESLTELIEREWNGIPTFL